MAYRKQGERANSSVGRVRWEETWRLVGKKHWTMAEAARSLNVSHETVRHYIKKGPPPGWNPPKETPTADVVELRPRAGWQNSQDRPGGA